MTGRITNKMKFLVEKTCNSGRLGTLILGSSDNENKFPTPTLIQTTKGGSIPFLSKEVFEYVSNETHILQLCLSSIHHMAESVASFKQGTAAFVGFRNTPIFLTIKDPCEEVPSGFNEKDLVPIFTRRGKEMLTVDSYTKLIEALQPDIYHSLCDSDTNEGSSKKRLRKSLDRTTDFLNLCLKKHKSSEVLSSKAFLAPVVGGYCKLTRTKSIEAVKNVPEVSGYILEGFHNSGISATNVNIDSLKKIVSHTMNGLNDEKLKMMMGPYNPLVVLEMVKLGVDVFDSSYTYMATKNFRALTFKFENDSSQDVAFSLCLKDDKYKNDFTPLLDDCTCLACRKHTKAYIYHLVQTNELLAPILLMIHNTHHYLQFFDAIRKAVCNDKLPQLIELLEKQIPVENGEEIKDKATIRNV